jgi:hypothetical protein
MTASVRGEPTVSREPDGIDHLAKEFLKGAFVMTPEQRERRSRLEFPRVADDDTTTEPLATTDAEDKP